MQTGSEREGTEKFAREALIIHLRLQVFMPVKSLGSLADFFVFQRKTRFHAVHKELHPFHKYLECIR